MGSQRVVPNTLNPTDVALTVSTHEQHGCPAIRSTGGYETGSAAVFEWNLSENWIECINILHRNHKHTYNDNLLDILASDDTKHSESLDTWITLPICKNYAISYR